MAVMDRVRTFVNRPIVKFSFLVATAVGSGIYGTPCVKRHAPSLAPSEPSAMPSSSALVIPTATAAPTVDEKVCLGLSLSPGLFPIHKNVTGTFAPLALEIGKPIAVSATLTATADQLSGFSGWNFTIELTSNAGAKWRTIPFGATFSGDQVSATLLFSKEDILADQGTVHYLRARATDKTGRFSYILATVNNVTFGAAANPAPVPSNTGGKARPAQPRPVQNDPCKENPGACL